jgi:hypothetical protein
MQNTIHIMSIIKLGYWTVNFQIVNSFNSKMKYIWKKIWLINKVQKIISKWYLNFVLFSKYRAFNLIICHNFTNLKKKCIFVIHAKDISPKSYIFCQICKIFRQNCISFANFVIRIKHISTDFVKDLLLKCVYFT